MVRIFLDNLNNTMTVLTEENYFIYAAKAYNNPQCIGQEEFEDDLKRVHYVKKLLNKYIITGDLKTRLILNHITLLQNVFGVRPTANLLFLKLPEELYSSLKTFLVSKYSMPEIVNNINTNSIGLDAHVIKMLREL